jgi:hypothetical protein
MDNSSAIRTAAILYADDNQKSTQKTIHRKIIESIFVSVNNGELSIHQIIDKIKEQLELIFDENEVENIVHNDKKGYFDVRFDNKCEVSFIKMNNRRYELLKEKENTNNISIYIGQYVSTMYSGEISKDEVEVIIYKYVYELLNTNISAFKKITSSKYKAEDISISSLTKLF